MTKQTMEPTIDQIYDAWIHVLEIETKEKTGDIDEARKKLVELRYAKTTWL